MGIAKVAFCAYNSVADPLSGEPNDLLVTLKTNRKTKNNPALDWALDVAEIAQDKKGREVALLEVDGLVDYADYFVFVTGGNRRQVQAIADSIENEAKDRDHAARVEGYSSGWWVVLDVGGVVVHIFQPEARNYYELEHLWADATRVALRKQSPATAASRETV